MSTGVLYLPSLVYYINTLVTPHLTLPLPVAFPLNSTTTDNPPPSKLEVKLTVGNNNKKDEDIIDLVDADVDYDPSAPDHDENDEDLIPEDDYNMDDDYGSEDDEYDDDDFGERKGKPKNKKTTTTITTNTNTGRKKKTTTRSNKLGKAAKKKPTATAKRSRSRSSFNEEDEDLEAAFDSDLDPEDGAYILGAEDEELTDFSHLILKPDHANRPLWVCPDGRIFLETFSHVYRQAYDFLIAVAEPVSRPESLHEYALTPHSLYAAVSIGLETRTIETVLDRLSKVPLPDEVRDFIRASTENYGKVKLVLQRNKFFVESQHADILRLLVEDDVIADARVERQQEQQEEGFVVEKMLKEQAAEDLAAAVDEEDIINAAAMDIDQDGGDKDDDDDEMMMGTTAAAAATAAINIQQSAVIYDSSRETHSFEIEASKVERVKQRCLPGGLNYPMLEEYDFRNDTVNPPLNIELKPLVRHRPYQEKSLSKMFGNGRARSGVIVLPCGAGKSLVGVSAAARIKKSVLVLCTNAVSVDQWKFQFQLWTGLQDHDVTRFTADKHEWFKGQSGVAITTYTMIAYTGKRSEQSEKTMEEIMNREWGLIILDEVHVVPAQMFRRVIGIVKAHTKLGLTATLVREDALITDLNFLIGPKLYEANWLDLTKAGHIANVQCAEVWCPMTKEFMREYLRPGTTATLRQLLYVMNPTKLRACQYLVQYHETRGDKVIVFSDNIYALREYAVRMKKPFIYGGTGHQERTRILHAFKHNPEVNTVFLSKVGDNSLDIPEANVLVQISSHAGSRRQEAQRLGRILRKKKSSNRGGIGGAGGIASLLDGEAGGGGGVEEFDAFFYTLVSTDTQEVYFTAKRQRFLIDQGYAYKVIPSILDAAGGGGGLLLESRDEQLDVLATLLAVGETEELMEEQEEGIPGGKGGGGEGRPKTKRKVGSMAQMSGAVGMRYLEYSTGGAGGRGGGKASQSKGRLAKFRNK